jgi:DNA-binding response OmpR family regulator
MIKILVVEDDVNLGTTLAGALETLDYEVCYVSNADEALETFRSFTPDALITDVMLNASIDGFELARKIRELSDIPVLFTTSKDGTEDLRTGLSLGNSDYIRKPYRFVEVSLRLENLLSTYIRHATKDQTYIIGIFHFSPKAHTLRYTDETIEMTNYETAVLDLLFRNKGNYIRRDELVEQVWNEKDPKTKEASLNNILSRLRKYLAKDERIILESKINAGVRIFINSFSN